MATAYFNFNQLKTPTVKVGKPQKINVAQTTGKSALPNLSGLLKGVGTPMAVKKINVRNLGFKKP